jgi:hypothetical protein
VKLCDGVERPMIRLWDRFWRLSKPHDRQLVYTGNCLAGDSRGWSPQGVARGQASVEGTMAEKTVVEGRTQGRRKEADEERNGLARSDRNKRLTKVPGPKSLVGGKEARGGHDSSGEENPSQVEGKDAVRV